jgi:hypothetical protein
LQRRPGAQVVIALGDDIPGGAGFIGSAFDAGAGTGMMMSPYGDAMAGPDLTASADDDDAAALISIAMAIPCGQKIGTNL